MEDAPAAVAADAPGAVARHPTSAAITRRTGDRRPRGTRGVPDSAAPVAPTAPSIWPARMYAPPRPVRVRLGCSSRSAASSAQKATSPRPARAAPGAWQAPIPLAGAGEQAEAACGHRGGPSEHERHFPVAVMPGGHRGVTDQRCGIRGHPGTEQRRPRRRGSAHPGQPACQRADSGHPRGGHVAAEQPGAATLIGEVTLKTRIMLMNRAKDGPGRERARPPRPRPAASAPVFAARLSPGRPVRSAPAASRDDPASASPPRKKYPARSTSSHDRRA